MKIKKSLLLLLLISVIFSCSTDSEETPEENSAEVNSQYDVSNLGMYKGLFSTIDSEIRGTIEISLTENNQGSAQLTLNSGEIITLKTTSVVENKSVVKDLSFSSETANRGAAISLKFSVDENGANPVISDALINNTVTKTLIAKELSRVPLNPVSGTYVCNNCDELYPQFSRTNNTFSLLYTGPNNSPRISTFVMYKGREYISGPDNNTLNGCADVGSSRTCSVTGTSRIANYPMTYSGTYQFRINMNNPDCTYATGSWSMPIPYGTLQGTFVTDNTSPCP